MFNLFLILSFLLHFAVSADVLIYDYTVSGCTGNKVIVAANFDECFRYSYNWRKVVEINSTHIQHRRFSYKFDECFYDISPGIEDVIGYGDEICRQRLKFYNPKDVISDYVTNYQNWAKVEGYYGVDCTNTNYTTFYFPVNLSNEVCLSFPHSGGYGGNISCSADKNTYSITERSVSRRESEVRPCSTVGHPGTRHEAADSTCTHLTMGYPGNEYSMKVICDLSPPIDDDDDDVGGLVIHSTFLLFVLVSLIVLI